MLPADGAVAPTGNRRPRRGLWPLRVLVRIATTLVIVVTAVAAGVVCFALFPPADLLRRAALPVAQRILNHPNLHLGGFELSPQDGLEIRDLWLGPPAGYGLPLLTIRRILVRYDLSQIAAGQVHLRNVLVDRPVIRVESRAGKLSWIAFLEGLPKSKPKPEEPSEPSKLRIWIHRVSVIGLAAYLDDGSHRVSVDGLNLALSGLYSPDRARLDLSLRFDERQPGKSNLGLLSYKASGAGTELLGARFVNRLSLDLTVDGKPPAPGSTKLPALRAEIGLDLDLGSQELRSPWTKQPLRLRLQLRAQGDLPADKAKLDRLSITLNNDELCRLGAELEGLQAPRAAKLKLESIYLPLDRLLPYARGFLPGVEAGGAVRVNELEVGGPIEELKLQGAAAKLPQVSGAISLERVWAKVKRGALRAELRDLDLGLVFASRREGQTLQRTLRELLGSLPPLVRTPTVQSLTAAARSAPVTVQGRIHVGLARALGAELRGLELRLASGVDLAGIKPAALASRLQLDAGALRYQHPKLGLLELPLRTRLLAGADLRERRALCESLELGVADLIALSLRARAEDFGRKGFQADLELKPIDLARLLTRVPPRLRAQVAGLRLAGRVGLKLHAKGRTPTPRTPPLRLPVELDARVALEGIELDDKALSLGLSKLGGEITVKGKPSDLKIATDLKIGEVHKPDQQVTVEDLQLPIALRITEGAAPRGGGVGAPRSGRDYRIDGEMGLALGRLRKGDLGLNLRGFKLGSKLAVALPLEGLLAGRRVALGSSQIRTSLGIERTRLSRPGSRLTIGKLGTEIVISHTPGQAEPIRVAVKSKLASLQHAEQGAKLAGIALELQSAITGPSLSVPPRPEELQLKRASTRLGLSLGSLFKQGAIDQPLLKNRVDLDASVTGDGTLDLRSLAVRLPTRGIKLDLSGKASELRTLGLGPLPPFDLTVRAGLDNPAARDSWQATFLAPHLKGAGKVEFELRARRTSAYRVQLDGRLRAKAFNLWQRSLTTAPQPGGGLLQKETVIHAKDMNADVPVSQAIIVKLPSVTVPPPRASVLDAGAATALFSALQPYFGGRSRLSLGGVSLVEKLTGISREGYLLSSNRRRFAVDRLALDLQISDSTLRLSRMYLKLFGGDVAGQVLAQAVSLKPLDVRAVFRTQITGVNLAYLDQAAKERSAKTEISALVDVRYWMGKGLVEGRVDITRLSLDMLDALLAYLDPNKTNESVQNNRKLINAWYTKWINPKVKLVSIWITHGNLNMDIEMDAWFVAGTILKRTLKNMRIRRINILPLLPKGMFREEQTE